MAAGKKLIGVMVLYWALRQIRLEVIRFMMGIFSYADWPFLHLDGLQYPRFRLFHSVHADSSIDKPKRFG